MTINDALNFNQFYTLHANEKMSIKVAYKFAKILKTLETEFTFYEEERNKILNEYGEKDLNGQLILINDGQSIKIKEGKQLEALNKINELQETEITYNGPLFDIDDLENIEISPKDMNFIIAFIKD